jgi:hypothetical protein
MKINRIAITLLTLLPLSALADYRMIITAQDKSSIKFVNTEEIEVAALPVVEDPDACSSNLPEPVMAPGYPKVIKAGNYVQYLILYSSVGNYANQANITAQKYTKVLLMHTTGTQHGVDSAAWADTLTGWQVNPGETIRVVVTPSSYDTVGNSICAVGTPIELVNKTYDQLRNE